MASVIYTPTSPEEAIEVRTKDGRMYTFTAKVPKDVPIEDMTTITTALGNTGTTSTGTPADL